LEDNIVFFYPPSDIEKITNAKTKIRVGGLVKENSVVILSANKIRFTITDYKNTLIIEYTGILPALFREKQGIVAEGTFVDGVFEAKNLLAKHDENYMPPEVVKTLVK
jgi:cytochrome c-type biogenesis protein CcmE